MRSEIDVPHDVPWQSAAVLNSSHALIDALGTALAVRSSPGWLGRFASDPLEGAVAIQREVVVEVSSYTKRVDLKTSEHGQFKFRRKQHGAIFKTLIFSCTDHRCALM